MTSHALYSYYNFICLFICVYVYVCVPQSACVQRLENDLQDWVLSLPLHCVGPSKLNSDHQAWWKVTFTHHLAGPFWVNFT